MDSAAVSAESANPKRRRPGAAAVGVASALALVVALASPPALAWVRSTSSSGAKLWWPDGPIEIVVDSQGSDDLCPGAPVDGEGCGLDAITRAVATWAAVECPDGPLRTPLSLAGTEADPPLGYLEEGANTNVITWVDEPAAWRHSRAVLAVTSVTYHNACGMIFDADMELNGVSFTFTTSSSPLEIRTDVENTVTHELGHLLGLDHSDVAGATMQERAPQGESRKRTLEDDDREGVCAIFAGECPDLASGEGEGEGEGGEVLPPDQDPPPGDDDVPQGVDDGDGGAGDAGAQGGGGGGGGSRSGQSSGCAAGARAGGGPGWLSLAARR